MKRTGLQLDQIKYLLNINEEVRDYLEKKYPKEGLVKWYVAGLKEEYLRLLFRLPEGVKNIDIDCVEISNKGIIAFLEFKRGLLTRNSKKSICTYAEKCVLEELESTTGKPSYVLRFNNTFTKFQIFRVTAEIHQYPILSLENVWEWRRALTIQPTLPKPNQLDEPSKSFSLAQFMDGNYNGTINNKEDTA